MVRISSKDNFLGLELRRITYSRFGSFAPRENCFETNWSMSSFE